MNRFLRFLSLMIAIFGATIMMAGCGSDKNPGSPGGSFERNPSGGTPGGTETGTLTVALGASIGAGTSLGEASALSGSSDARAGIVSLILTFDRIRLHVEKADTSNQNQCSMGSGDGGMHGGSGGGMHGDSGGGMHGDSGGGMHGGSGGGMHGDSDGGMHGDNGGGMGMDHDSSACEVDSVRCCQTDSTRYMDILTGPVTVNTGELGPTLTTLLATGNVPSGKYSHLDLRISAARILTDAGVETPATVAMGDSLLRVMTPFVIAQGQVTSLVLTIDPNRSVRETPLGSGQFFLQPVLSGSVQDNQGNQNDPHHGHGSGGPAR